MEAIAIGSLLEELARRETAARKRIEVIREQIERLVLLSALDLLLGARVRLGLECAPVPGM